MLSTYGFKLYFSNYTHSFLGEKLVLGYRKNKTAAIIGWGYKKKTEYPRKIAQKHAIPYLALEDGFYRSLDLGCKGARPYSLIVDKTGIYYNSFQRSDLEDYLNDTSWITEANVIRAERAISFIVSHNLSKYNHAPDISPDYFDQYQGKNKILVVDQTYNDASVLYSGANEQSFAQMVEDALKLENTQVFIKMHPDVISKKKKGYLADYIHDSRIKLIHEDFSPLSLLKQMDKVFVVSSQMGFEALLLNKEVYCYGMPFYAGWGLTHDKLTCERRRQKHTIESLFYASCILYPRYVHPVSKKKCQLEDILSLLAVQKFNNDQNRGNFVCTGFSFWKYPHARAYLQGTDNKVYFSRSFADALERASEYRAKLVVWSSKISEDFAEKCYEKNIPLIRMEDGFLRSTGLGSDFNFPFSLVLDDLGIYYSPLHESALEKFLQHFSERSDRNILRCQADVLLKMIVAKGLSKYNVGNSAVFSKKDFTLDKTLILVPGQVEDDASVRLAGGKIQSNLDLLKNVRRLNPDACIIFKPHPDVEKLNRKGKVPEKEALQYADYVVNNINIINLFEIVDEVHTLTSLSGFEALIRNVKVICYGMPFYAGWGLTKDLQKIKRRTAKLDILDLVAGTLLLYPRYYDWDEKCFCRAIDICSKLSSSTKRRRSPIWARYATIIREWIRN